MKIDSITLENFGFYKNRVFSFGQAPLVLIYGANEAGKTTTLNGIRQAIFGFRSKSEYFLGGTTRAEVQLGLASGDAFSFQRKKGRPDKVECTRNGTEVDEGDLKSILCDLDLVSYEQLFGFSQDELRLGQDALKSVRLSDALAGGGIGGIRAFEKLRQDFHTSLTDLYKSRGTTPKINVKLSDIKAAQEKLREVEVLPAEIESLRSKLRAAEESSEADRKEYRATFERKSQAATLLQALPLFQKRRSYEAQLADIDLPAEMNASFIAKWGDYAEERKRLAEQVAKEKTQLEDTTNQLESMSGDGSLLEFESQIEELGHQAAEIGNLRKRQVELKEQAEESESSVKRLLEALQLTEVTEQLRSFTLSIPERSKLEKSSASLAEERNTLLSLTAKLDAAQDTIREHHLQDEAEIEDYDLAELAEHLDRWEEAQATVSAKAQVLEAAAEGQELQELTATLEGNLLPGYSLSENWRMPSLELLKTLSVNLSESMQKLERAKLELKQCQAELDDHTAEGKDIQNADAQEVLRKTEEIACQRDAVLDQWLDELSQPLIAASITVEQQTERLEELKRIAVTSDRNQQTLLDMAEAIAHEKHRLKIFEKLEAKRSQRVKTEKECEAALKSAEAEWGAQWKHLPVQDMPPSVALEWAQTFSRWLGASNKIRDLKRQLHIARGVVKSIKGEVLDQWPTVHRNQTDLQVLWKQLRSWQEAERDSENQQQRIKKTQAGVNELTSRIASVEKRRELLEGQLTSWLKSSPVDCEWPLEKLSLLLETLDGLIREDQTLTRVRSQSAEIQQRCQGFEAATAELAKSLGKEIKVSVSLEQLAKGWLKSLHEVRSERTNRAKLTANSKSLEKHLQEKVGRVQEIDSKLSSLCSKTGLGDAAEVSYLLNQARQAEELRHELSKCNAAIVSLCNSQSLEEFISCLEASKQSELELEIRELTQQMELLERRKTEAEQEIGSLNQRLEQLAGGKEAQSQLSTINGLRSELAELADQWILERVGQELLRRTIDNFSRDHEPRLLQHTRDYIARLTGGRYIDVVHDNSSKSEFTVKSANGVLFEPSALSTGTREQLYLAIRMAYIAFHSESHEPLPVIMDDCFVNFDDERTRHAIQCISEWDDNIQTVLLSCHSRTLDIVADVAPGAKVIHLEHGKIAEELAVQGR